MTHDRRLTYEKIGRRLKLLEPLVFRDGHEIAPFRFQALADALTPPPLGGDPAAGEVIDWNSYWAGQDQNFYLSSSFEVPKDWAMDEVALHLPMGVAGDIFTHPESLLHIDGRPLASADRYHHTVALDPALADGRPHRLELHGWSGLTNWPPDPNDGRRLYMRPCRVVRIDPDLRAFLVLARTAHDLAGELDDARGERTGLLSALDAAFGVLDTREPFGAAFRASVRPALARLEEALARAGAPLDVTLHGIGHAHIDIAYLWPISQTRQKTRRTTANVLRLMERFPDYRYSQTQPQLYDYLRDDDPKMFAAVKARVADGSWEPMGGMWVEPDTNIPGGESLVRQLVLGQRFFAEHFGGATPVLWLPDVFGLSWAVPQLAAQAGMKWVVTNKPSWNQYNPMPSSTTWWQGIDGTRILTHMLTTPREVQYLPVPTNYKSDLTAEEVVGTWTRSTTKGQITDLPIAFGYGDGGGGPTEDLIRTGQAYGALPGAPRFAFSTVSAAMEAIEAAAGDLPVWNDEIYLELHRGTYTSQAWIKRANRKAEARLHELEFLAALAQLKAGPDAEMQEGLETTWKLLCLQQFHDILPGSSIAAVFDDARKDFATITETTRDLTDRALARLSHAGSAPLPVLINALPFTMARQVEVAAGTDGLDPRSVQPTHDGRWLCHLADAPGYALVPLRADTPARAVTAQAADGGAVLDNGLVRAVIDDLGRLTSLTDLATGREAIAPGQAGNVLQCFEDRPINWDAWDIDAYFEDRGEDIATPATVELLEDGPLRATVRVTRDWRGSRIVQEIRLSADSPRLDFCTTLDWHEPMALLKVAFPVDVFAQEATYDIQFGSIARPTHRNTSWDHAKFEAACQKWVDLSEGDFGVALLNDGKYGADVRENVLRLSLVKTSQMPDPKADIGEHRFTYALMPHTGDWRNGVIEEAYALNTPASVRTLSLDPADAPGQPLVSVDERATVIETVKPADDGDGIVLRLYDAHRTRGPRHLRFEKPMASVIRQNILEEGTESLATDTREVGVPTGPFEVVTLRCKPEV